jgi:hypothetical protein
LVASLEKVESMAKLRSQVELCCLEFVYSRHQPDSLGAAASTI